MNKRMSEKKERARFGVTMTKSYVDALDYLVDEGVYLSRGEAILDALRRLFDKYEIEPFSLKADEPEDTEQNSLSQDPL